MSTTIPYHCWIQNTDTGKIIDPDFPLYSMVRQIRNCTEEQQHQKFPNGRMKKLVKEQKFAQRAKALKELYDNDTAAYYRHRDQWFGANCCATNVLFSFVENGAGKNLKFCVGRMGWKQKGGGVWWEYE